MSRTTDSLSSRPRDSTEMPDEPIFSWVHASDIHRLQPPATAAAEQRLILNELVADVSSFAKQGRRIQALIITGDIGYSGAALNAEEYQHAQSTVSRIQAACGAEPCSVFTVPGNHDISLQKKHGSRNLARALKNLRGGMESIDDALQDPEQREMLLSRQESYTHFASAVTTAKINENIAWVHRFYASNGVIVRLVGFNSSLLSDDEGDRGRLELGSIQLDHAYGDQAEENEVIIALSHHPFHGGWLRDEARAASWTRRHAQIHLTGHVHEQRIRVIGKPGSRLHVELGAGAAHDASDHRVMGYFLCQLLLRDQRKLVLRVTPRAWGVARYTFVSDPGNCDDNSDATEYVLRDIRSAPRNPKVPILNTTSPLRERAYPILAAGLSTKDLVRLVEDRLSTHVGFLARDEDSLHLCIRRPPMEWSALRETLLNAAILLSDCQVSRISVGAYDTSDNRMLLGKKPLSLLRFSCTSAHLRQFSAGQIDLPSFHQGIHAEAIGDDSFSAPLPLFEATVLRPNHE